MTASTTQDARFETTYLGDTVGRWEGDTLVLDSIGFVDTTWLGRGGFFHSDEMHVVEKFTRQGDVHSLRRHGRRPRGAGGAVGVADTNGAAQPKSRRGPIARARQLRSVRTQQHLLTDPPLDIPLPPGEGAAKRRVRAGHNEMSRLVRPHPALRATFSRREKDFRIRDESEPEIAFGRFYFRYSQMSDPCC